MTLPRSPGTYVLILEARRRRRLRVGALGTLELVPGFYAYVGSARGPGGLSARVGRHCRRVPCPHWHVDYLRRYTVVREVWLAQDRTIWEHRFADVLGAGPVAGIPLPRFGATDCSCRTHLFRFRDPPRVSTFRRSLVASVAPDGVAPAPEVTRWVAGRRGSDPWRAGPVW